MNARHRTGAQPGPTGRKALLGGGAILVLALAFCAELAMAEEPNRTQPIARPAPLEPPIDASTVATGESVRIADHLADACDRAADGDAEAQYALGALFFFGRGGVAYQPDKAAAWFERATAQGHRRAGNLLRYIHERGVRGSRDDGCAFERRKDRSAPPREIIRIVDRVAPTGGVDAELVLAVIAIESSFRVDAISPKGALGLMQLLPETASRFGVINPFDPVQNIRGGVEYLKWLLRRFDGELRLALAAYNAGEEAVDRHRGIPPFPETRHYVAKVQELYDRTKSRPSPNRAPIGAAMTPLDEHGILPSREPSELAPK